MRLRFFSLAMTLGVLGPLAAQLTVDGQVQRRAVEDVPGTPRTAGSQRTPVEADPKAGEVLQPPTWPAKAVRAAQAMIVSDEALASEAGVAILKKGGNAVDAAVAVALVLAVVHPSAGNLGGGGFMLVRMADGRTGLVDYRETAPGRASRNMYTSADGTLDNQAATVGYRSVAVPGTLKGMEVALGTYGTKKLADVAAPAIRLAEQGFPVSEKLATSLRAAEGLLERFPRSRRIFLRNGTFYAPGETLRQPELAATLRRIARKGAAEFYRGQTARRLAEEMKRMGGLLTAKDLATYEAKLRKPLHAKYSFDGIEWEIISAPPPSSGGVALIEALNILSDVKLASWTDPQSVHWVAEAMRRVFADRAAYLADPDFARVPVRGLTDLRYAAELRRKIDPERAALSSAVRAGDPSVYESEKGTPTARGSGAAPDAQRSRHFAAAMPDEGQNTTHFSVVDAAGNAVSNTYTLNESYGSGVTTSAGFLLNDTMDDFTTQPGVPNKLFDLIQSEANAIAPGKRPLSSMTPTIVLRNGALSFLTGSPGGPRIISATLLSVLEWIRLGAEAQAAINAPRFHHQWIPDTLWIEEALPATVAQELARRGHNVRTRMWIGDVEAIGIDSQTKERLGAPDPRRRGAAAGY